MPPCHIRNVKLVAEAGSSLLSFLPFLPFLPFLAPRVFQPWPFGRQPSRTYTNIARRASKRARARVPTSRSRIAKDWYENAFAPLDSQLVEQHEQEFDERREGEKEQDSAYDERREVDEQQGSAYNERREGEKQQDLAYNERRENSPVNPRRTRATSPSRSPDQDYKQLQRTNAERRQLRSTAWANGRRAAYWAAKHSTLPTKWVCAGHPVRLRTKPAAVSSDDQLQLDDEDTQHANQDYGYAIPENIYRWNICFAKIQARYDKRLSLEPATHTLPVLEPKATEYAKRILDHPEATLHVPELVKQFNRSWEEIWMHAMLHLLQSEPNNVPRFLKRTHLSPHPPAAWVNDSLQFLATAYSTSDTPVPQESFDELVDTLCTVMDRSGSRPLIMRGSCLHLLFRRCTKDQMLRLCDSMGHHRVQTHWRTQLHLATCLARHDCFDKALDAMLESASSGAEPKSSQFESTCSTILRNAATQSDGLRVSLRIIQNLAELGVKLNVQHCNIVMLNAVECGDLKSAYNVYHSLVDNGLQADKYTHAILLKGCKPSIDDSETLNAIIRQAIKDTEIIKSPVVATEILHCLYLHHFQRNPDTAFSTLVEAYTQLFDATSLIRMHMLPADCQDASQPTLPRPTRPALWIMVSAYLRNRTDRHGNQSAHQQYNLYKQIRVLAERGVQPWVALTQSDHISNAFLMAFAAHPSSLAHAAEVIRDMQTPLPALPDNANPKTHVEREVCKPTVQSWSIFLHAFARHKKMDLAEQVLQYMREKGMQPNQVTWNSLVGGYAGIRDAEGAANAFKRMQEEGHKGDERTFRAMAKVSVDAGMLSQGEEVREALRRRIERQEMLRAEYGKVATGQSSVSPDELDKAAAEYWESAQEDVFKDDEKEHG
ncbi:hypothetical protein BDV97DRAFT_350502 [Delphinella strobiligena]|nr:hypothetical protein BDV97DRAFT_350502 [Delphinella strobiligena]